MGGGCPGGSNVHIHLSPHPAPPPPTPPPTNLFQHPSYKFKFDGIFDMDSTQEDVFNTIAKESCNR